METTCVIYSRDYIRTPGIVAIDSDRCAIADGTGNITIVDFRTKEVGPSVFVGMVAGKATNLRSLRSDPTRPNIVAVATRAAYAALVDLERQAITKIHPVSGGTVQALAIAPDGQALAIGTGGYSASGPPQAARVEVWSLATETGPQYVQHAALPGVCVDAIAWSTDGTRLACAVGARSQKAGVVAQLDNDHLRSLSYFETAWAESGRIGYLDSDTVSSHLAIAFQNGFRVLTADDGREAWRFDRPGVADIPIDFDVIPDERQIVLSTGAVRDALDGSPRSKFLAMNDCTSIAARPGSGYVGVTASGRVFCWG